MTRPMRKLPNVKLRACSCLAIFLAVVWLSPAATTQAAHRRRQTQPPPAPPPPVEQLSAKEMVRRAMQHDVTNWEQEKNYTFVQRIEQHEINPDGSAKTGKSETEEIIFLYGQPYAHLIKRNDQPLSDAE